MNLYIRILRILVLSPFRRTRDVLAPIFSSFRVWPTDLDFLGHMTNSRYLSLMDAGRTDLLARAGLIPKLRAKGWYPVVVEQSIHYRRSLNPLETFQLKTEITGYDDRHIILQQTFLRKNKVAALAIVRARFLGPDKQRVSPQDFLGLAGLEDQVAERQIPVLEKQKYEHFRELIEAEGSESKLVRAVAK